MFHTRYTREAQLYKLFDTVASAMAFVAAIIMIVVLA